MKITTRFRDLLKRPELLVMPGGFSPLHARMAEALGYEAFFMAGSQIAAYIYGLPDVGIIGARLAGGTGVVLAGAVSVVRCAKYTATPIAITANRRLPSDSV